jgi:hypothetical protein
MKNLKLNQEEEKVLKEALDVLAKDIDDRLNSLYSKDILNEYQKSVVDRNEKVLKIIDSLDFMLRWKENKHVKIQY